MENTFLKLNFPSVTLMETYRISCFLQELAIGFPFVKSMIIVYLPRPNLGVLCECSNKLRPAVQSIKVALTHKNVM